jgi:2-(1,2-epoxy-1,2-dihydrophenyl)acetyl-CoA isomerase
VSDTVRYVVAGSVASITLNRPEARNALNAEMKTALLAAAREAAADDQVRAIIVTGAGRAFCSGQDLREHADALASGADPLGTVRAHYNPIINVIAGMPKPVIAAVNGVAAGAGASLAFACDFRLAARGASVLMAFARVGLGPDSGSSWTMQRLAAGPTAAFAAIKEALDFAATHTLAESLEKEADLQTMLGRTEDHRAATLAFVQKEQPVYHGR